MNSNVYNIIAAHIMQKRAEAQLHKEASVGAAIRGALRSLKGKQFRQAASRLKSGLSPKFKPIGSVGGGKLRQPIDGDIYRTLIGMGLGGAGLYGAGKLIDSLKDNAEV